MSFLIFIIFMALVVLMLIPTLIYSLVRTLLSMLGFVFTGKKRKKRNDAPEGYGYRGGGASGEEDTRSGHKKKLFDKDEGEYVDFEEIKENK